MGDNEQMVLTHIPLLRISEEFVPFADGRLLRLPFEEFDYLVMGAFTDSKRDYERTAPVFFEQSAIFTGMSLDGSPVTESLAPRTVTAAMNLAVPAFGLPDPDLSFSIVTGGPNDLSRQGDADLELLFHHEAARPVLSPAEVETARAMVPLILRGGDEALNGCTILSESAGPSLGIDERLTLCTIALEAMLFPDVTTNSRETFVRRLTNLVGIDHPDEVAGLADAIYRARTQALHRLPGTRERLDPAARCLLARTVIAVDGADLGELRSTLDTTPQAPADEPRPMPPLDWTGALPADPLMRLPEPRESMPSSWNPEQPDVGDDQLVAFFPLLGCDVEWPPPAGFPITQLSSGQLTGLEDPDIRRDWVSRIDGCACVALTKKAEKILWARDASAHIDDLRPMADLAVQTMRLAGLSEFVDPDLLGDFALSDGSFRYRRGTVFRQTAMLRGRPSQRLLTATQNESGLEERQMSTLAGSAPPDDAPRETISSSEPDLVALWSLLLEYADGERSAPIDEALVLFRRAHDAITLNLPVRLQLLFGCLELMVGRIPRPEAPHPIDALSKAMSDPAPLHWYRTRGNQARNALAHGSWDGASDPDALQHLVVLARTLIPCFIGSWLEASRRPEPSKALVRALKSPSPVSWRRSPPEATLMAADQLRYRGLDVEIDLTHAQAAKEAGDEARERGYLLRAVAEMPTGVSSRPAGHVSAIHRLGILQREAGDHEMARALLEGAAAFGDADAMNSLGVLERRDGRLADARLWYGRAAEGGQHRAYFNQALMEEDEGNLGEAERLYRLGADAGDTSATYNLGCLLMGFGRQEAVDQFARAAGEGHTGAMLNLADISRRAGQIDNARYWLTMAQAAGDDRATEALQALGSG